MLNVIILGLVSFFTDISSEMIYPILPLYLVNTLGATPFIVGIIEGIAESLASLLKVFSGYFSDKIKKRKPLAISGYGISTVGKLLLYLSGSWTLVLAGRVSDRFGKGIRTSPRDALIADSVSKEKRGSAYGFHRFMDTLGAAIGIIAAYYFLFINPTDYSKIFLLAIIPAGLGVLILFFAKEEISPVKTSLKPAPLKFNWSSLDRRLKIFLIIVFLFTLGNSSNLFILLRAQNLGFAPPLVILLYLVYNLVYAFCSWPAGKISDKIGRKPVIAAGYAIYGLVYLGLAVVKSPARLWFLLGVYGIYHALTEGVEKAFVSDIAPAEQRGTLIGLHATLVGIGLLPASIIAGFLWNTLGAASPFYLGGALGILASLGLFLLI